MKNRQHIFFIVAFMLVIISGSELLYGQTNVQPNEQSANKDWLEMIQDPNVNFYEVQSLFNKYWENRTDYKGNGYKVFKRWEYINESRVLPDGKLQAPGYVFNQYEKYMKTAGKSASGNWTIQGPTSYPGNNTGQPTGMGRINAVAFHPTEANTIFVGSPSGGFWKTTNNGTSWTNLSNNLPTIGVSSILIHPTTPNTIYIGTGDRDASDALPMGVFKSTDGGSTWNQINSSMGDVTVGVMLMHPSDANTILAATSGGIYKTSDGGTTWSQKASGNFKDIKFKPGDPTYVYATKITTPSEFYRSTNTGDSWTQITSGIPTSGIGSRMVIGVSEANSNYVYLVQIKSSDNTFAGLLRSTNSGTDFTSRSTSPNIFGYPCDGSGTASQATYDLCITVDPTDEDIVYVGSINNWKWDDNTSTWTIISHWVGSSFAVPCAVSVHADQHWYEWSPHNGNLYVGNDGGVYYTADGGSTWPEITNNLAITQIYKIGQGAANTNYTLFGCQDNGSAATSNGSDFTTVWGGDGAECLIDYSNTNYCYVSPGGGRILRSTTGPTGSYSEIVKRGTNGVGSDESGTYLAPYMLHETNASVMFAGYENVFRCDNIKAATVSFSAISSGETTQCKVLEQSPADVDIVYAVRSGSLKRTDNANVTPASVSWTACALPGGSTPTDLEAHPTNANIVYATTGYNVYKSTDKGANWTDISSNLPGLFINCIVMDKNSSEGLYIGNQTGVWYKDATLSDWALFSSGLPPVDIRELEIYYDAGTPSNNRIKAATYGRGLWESDLAEVNVIDPSDFTASAVSTSEIDLAWTKNVAGDNVMIAWAPTTTFGVPMDGTAYSAGNSLSGGGTILYVGNLSAFSHSTLNANTTYYYKIWSVDGSDDYSAGLPSISETTDCSAISTLPFTENFDNPECWRVKDNTGEGEWQFGTNNDDNLTAPFAYFESEYTIAHNYNTDLISPTFDLTGYTNVALQFNHVFDASGSHPSTGKVYYSIDNGSNWIEIASYSSDTGDPESVTLSLNATGGYSQVKIKWNYISTPTGAHGWAVDDVQISDNSNYWTGTTNSDWFETGNWSTSAVPTSSSSVVIPLTAPNQPQINAAGAVCQNLEIQSGATLTMNASTAYTLSVAGDWINNGTFTRGIGTVDFNGSTALQTIKGSSTTNFNILSVSKGAANKILEATAQITTSTSVQVNSGTFKLNNAASTVNLVNGLLINSTKGVWLNAGTINLLGVIYAWGGNLRVSGGILNTGTHIIYYHSGGSIIVEGGQINAKAIQPYTTDVSVGTYTQSGGTVTLGFSPSTSTDRAPFDITSGSTFTMSDGTICIQRVSSFSSEFKNLATTNTITGGTLQIGNASTPANQTIRINSTAPIWNLTVNTTNSPTAQLLTNGLTVLNDVTISGGTLNANNLNLNVGGNWTNNSTFTPGTGTVTLNGITAQQNLAGTTATSFYNLTVDNANGVLLNGSVNTTVNNVLTFTSGVIATGSNKLIIPAAGSVSRTSGHVFGNLQKNIGTGSSIARTFEIGDASLANYSPVSITFASVSTSGNLVATTVSGDNPNIYSATLNANKSVNRYWSLNNSGTTFTTYDAVFNFLTDDVDAAASTSNLICGKYSASAWTYPTVGTRTATSVQITGLNSSTLSDVQLAESYNKVSITAGGNWSNANTWTPSGVPIASDNVLISSTGTVVVDVTDAECNDLTVQSDAVLQIDYAKALTVNGILTNSAGTSGLIVKSDATGTGSLMHSTTNVDATFERYMNDTDWANWQDGWHFLSSPMILQAIDPEFTTAPYDFYCWYEPENLWVNFKNTTEPPTWNTANGSTNFSLGKGYMAAYDAEDTKQFTGKLNTEDVDISGLTITGASANKSWHLLGNPFGSALTWDASGDWSLSNISGVAKIWNESNQSYTDLSSDPVSVIPATNGFFVQVSPSAPGSLTLPASKRIHSTVPFYKTTMPGITLKAISLSEGNAQESRIIVNPAATQEFDLMYDSEFLAGYAPQFYSIEDDLKLSTNSMPEIAEQTEIKFGFVKNEGSDFRIEASSLESLENQAYLHDLKTGVITNLNENPVYDFTSDEGDDPARFELRFGAVGINDPSSGQSISAWYANGMMYLSTEEGSTNVDIFNIQGQNLYKHQLHGSGIQSIPFNLPAGVYFARIMNGDNMQTVKIICR